MFCAKLICTQEKKKDRNKKVAKQLKNTYVILHSCQWGKSTLGAIRLSVI